MLFMRSVDDLHARARIRNAAVARFGQDGFGIGMRAIAADAGVSPALIVHHFGSKDGLRQACDEHVMRVIAEAKLDTMGAAGPEHMLAQLAAADEYAPAAAYAVASLAAGGNLARQLIEQMTQMTVDFLSAGEAAGTVRPSRDPLARARYLIHSSLGMLLLAYRLRAEADEPLDLQAIFADLTDEVTWPALELYTEGLFTDSRFLDAYLAATADAPHDPSQHQGEAR